MSFQEGSRWDMIFTVLSGKVVFFSEREREREIERDRDRDRDRVTER